MSHWPGWVEATTRTVKGVAYTRESGTNTFLDFSASTAKLYLRCSVKGSASFIFNELCSAVTDGSDGAFTVEATPTDGSATQSAQFQLVLVDEAVEDGALSGTVTTPSGFKEYAVHMVLAGEGNPNYARAASILTGPIAAPLDSA